MQLLNLFSIDLFRAFKGEVDQSTTPSLKFVFFELDRLNLIRTLSIKLLKKKQNSANTSLKFY